MINAADPERCGIDPREFTIVLKPFTASALVTTIRGCLSGQSVVKAFRSARLMQS